LHEASTLTAALLFPLGSVCVSLFHFWG